MADILLDINQDAAQNAAIDAIEVVDALQNPSLPPGCIPFVPPAYMQTPGDAALQFNSAAIMGALRFPTPADYTLRAIGTYVTAVAVAGNINLKLCEVSEYGGYEPNGTLNGSSTGVDPTMTSNVLPAPNVVGLFDSAGANAEAGAGYEAFEAMDGSVAADNGTRSNAAPTGIAPIIFTLDNGLGVTLRINKFRLTSFNNADANVRAFPKAFTFWGSNAAAPAPQTDGDWTQITGASAWTGETDPGAGLTREYYVNNAVAYRHYRLKITDRTGANAYVAIGEIELIAAQLSWIPGTEIYDIGAVASGAVADTWIIKTLTAAQQLDRAKSYCVTWAGTAAKDYSLSMRRWHTGAGSMFPDGCEAKQSSDTGATWTQCQQDSKPALINFVINPTSNGTPQLHIGRGGKTAGAYVYLPGDGLTLIPQAGIQVNCEALTASVDHATQTAYEIYLYKSAGVLTAEAVTTAPTTYEGIKVKTGATTHRWLGSMYVKNLLSTFQGPIDVEDSRWLVPPDADLNLGKECPYSTATNDVVSSPIWRKIMANDDFKITFATNGPCTLVLRFECLVSRCGFAFRIDTKLYKERGSYGGGNGATYEPVCAEITVPLSKGLHSVWPYAAAIVAGTGGFPFLFGDIGESQNRYVRAGLRGSVK